jgi:hypothetical protein
MSATSSVIIFFTVCVFLCLSGCWSQDTSTDSSISLSNNPNKNPLTSFLPKSSSHIVDENIIKTVARRNPITRRSKWKIKIYGDGKTQKIIIISGKNLYVFRIIKNKSNLIMSKETNPSNRDIASTPVDPCVVWSIYKSVTSPRIGPVSNIFSIEFQKIPRHNIMDRQLFNVVVSGADFSDQFWLSCTVDDQGVITHINPAF